MGGVQRRAMHVFHKRLQHPLAFVGDVIGREEGLREFYEEVIPEILAAATESTGCDVRATPPLRFTFSDAKRHCGDWRDRALRELLLARWVASRRPGGPAVFAEWP